MANLLPQQYQKRERRRLRARYLAATSLVSLGVAFIAFLALLPGFFEIVLDSAGRTQVPSLQKVSAEDTAKVIEMQLLVARLAPLYGATSTPTDLIAAALADKPAGISVEHIGYSAPQVERQILIEGSAKSPRLIDSYRASLANDPHFIGASVPLGALIGDGTGSFSITVTAPSL